MRQFGSYLPLVLKGELRGANPSTRGLGWANLWCTGCYANSSAGQLSWYGRTAAPREILLYTSSRTRFLNITSIGERCKHREVFSDLVLNERTCTFHNQNERKSTYSCNCGQSRYLFSCRPLLAHSNTTRK